MAQNIVCLVAITLALGKSKYSAILCGVFSQYWLGLITLFKSSVSALILVQLSCQLLRVGDVLSNDDCGFGFFKQALSQYSCPF